MTEEEEIEGVKRMIAYYCKKKHGTDGKHMCPECEELAAYMAERRHLCPWGDDKPFCANCPIHCYKPEMREKIRAVMRYAAPRVTFIHPIMAFKHLSETIKTNKKRKKRMKENGGKDTRLEEIKEMKASIAEKKQARERQETEANKAVEPTPKEGVEQNNSDNK